jgi:holliday junction DNA helicase RuvA
VIARLRGAILEKDLSGLVVDVGGVGYAVSVPLSCLEKMPGPEVDLFIHTHVREDALQLFGFLTRQERSIFRKLLTVNGVGPGTALAILSGLNVDELILAVAERDHRKLQGIPRIGKKTAERICLELGGKVAGVENASATPGFLMDELQDAVSALTNLGYRPQDASSALKHAKEAYPEGPVATWIREALRALSPR